MEVVTYTQLAQLIDCHNHEDKMTKYVVKTARDNNLIIMMAVGDNDTIQFDGAFFDEADLHKGGDVFIAKDGVYTKSGEGRKKINVFWEEHRIFLWRFLTNIPHEKFTVKKCGKNWCQGIVFSLNDV